MPEPTERVVMLDTPTVPADLCLALEQARVRGVHVEVLTSDTPFTTRGILFPVAVADGEAREFGMRAVLRWVRDLSRADVCTGEFG